MPTLRIMALALAAILTAAACTGAASPTPSVAAPSLSQASSASPSPAESPSPSPAAASTSPAASTGAGNAVEIKGFAFNPPSITVKVGAKVTWTNQDSTGHTVTFDQGGDTSDTLASGKTYSEDFTKAGTFTYHCRIHPSMKGTVVVSQ
ncbi:MAG: plastocyanin [Chloroflexi bacterium]|nr:MAG: plastocyanin [Chloroflexota bacterium]